MVTVPSAASAVGERFASEIRRGAAAFQRDGDGWGVAAVVDRARPAAFSCDQDLVLRQAMADRGWSVPQFVARRPPDGRAEGVELPRHSAVEALGGIPAEPPSRRVWHVSSASLAPLPPPPGVGRPEMAVRIVRAVARSAGVELAEGGSVGWRLRCRAGAFGASSRARRLRRATASSGRLACCARWWRRWRGRGS